MNNIKLRLSMVELGWHSEDEFTSFGFGDKTGYKAAFSRYDWHGKHCDGIYFSKVTIDLAKTDECLEKAACLAKKAWDEFPDSIPCVDSKGNLVVDHFHTDLWKSAPTIEEIKKRRAVVQEERQWMIKDKIQMSYNQFHDMGFLHDHACHFSGLIHRFYLRSDQGDIDDLVQLGLVEYHEEARNGKLVLKLTTYGHQVANNKNYCARHP